MYSGQVTVFAPGGPGHDALFPPQAGDADLPSCEANGILWPVTGIGTPLIGRVLVYDARDASFSEISY